MVIRRATTRRARGLGQAIDPTTAAAMQPAAIIRSLGPSAMQSENLAAIQAGATTVPYPGAGIPASASPQEAITYGAASPTTGKIDQALVNYMIQGGPPPASVLAVDPLAATIQPLSTVEAQAAASAQAPSLWDLLGLGNTKPGGLSLNTWLLVGGGLALFLILRK